MRVVVGLDRLAILIHGAFALAGDVEDFAQANVAPDFGPVRIVVAIDGFAVFVGCRLVVALYIKNLGNAIVGKRTALVDLQGLIEFRQRFRKIALLGQLLSSADGHAHAGQGSFSAPNCWDRE